MSQKLPNNPEELEDIIILDNIEIEPKQRRKNRVYTRELIDSILDRLPNHGILIIVKDDGTECEE